MKKFDYFCIVYSIALLVFGFTDDPQSARALSPKSEVRGVEQKKPEPIQLGAEVAMVQHVPVLQASSKPPATIGTFSSTR